MKKALISGSARASRSARTFVVHGAPIPAPPLEPGLYVVATPIGNLGDVTLRALAVLAGADGVLAEDTRLSRTLLAHYGIDTPLSPYHEHNAAEARPLALRRMAEGQALALVSDAGTPLISDPGYKLVAEINRLGPRGHCGPRGLGGACGSLHRRPADRPVLLRGFPAAEERRAEGAHQRSRQRAGHAPLL